VFQQIVIGIDSHVLDRERTTAGIADLDPRRLSADRGPRDRSTDGRPHAAFASDVLAKRGTESHARHHHS
jgi:hypothetical protein